MTKEIWITVIATIIQVITMFIIGYWQVATAKKIVTKGSDRDEKKIGFFGNLFSKYSNKLINLFFIINSISLCYVVSSDIKINKFVIAHIAFLVCSLFFLIIGKIFLNSSSIAKESFDFLYCMICRFSGEEKPPCIEKVKEKAREN
jgi:hypothetical protein